MKVVQNTAIENIRSHGLQEFLQLSTHLKKIILTKKATKLTPLQQLQSSYTVLLRTLLGFLASKVTCICTLHVLSDSYSTIVP